MRGGSTASLSSLAVRFGWVSLFQDLGSKMVVPMVPLFLTLQLGASSVAVGVVDGLAAAMVVIFAPGVGRTATLTNAPALTRLGYAISSLAKLALAAVGSIAGVLIVRMADRAGKGIRDTPRDLLLSASVESSDHARVFGWQQAMDKLGGAVGPLLGLAIYRGSDGSFDAVFVAAFVPCLLSVLIIPSGPRVVGARRTTPTAATLGVSTGLAMTPRQRGALVLLGVGTAATVPVALVIVRGLQSGASVTAVLLAFSALRLVTAAVAVPAGRVAGRIGPRRVVAASYLITAMAMVLALIDGVWVIWGVLPLLGLADGLFRAPAKAWLLAHGGDAYRGAVLGSWAGVRAGASLVAGLGAGLAWGTDGSLPLSVSAGALIVLTASLIVWRT